MTDDPRPPFFDQTWWQAFTSGALSSAVRTGIVALAVAGVGIALGIIRTDGGVQRFTIGSLGVMVALIANVIALALVRTAGRRPKDERSELYTYAIVVLTCAGVITAVSIVAAVNVDPHLCEKNPVACQDSGEG